MGTEPSAPARRTERAQHIVQFVLRAGLAASGTLMALGLVWAIATGQQSSGVVRPATLTSSGSEAERIIAVGLILLAVTPVVRVITLVGIWLHERDTRFVWLGIIVLAILTASALFGSA